MRINQEFISILEDSLKHRKLQLLIISLKLRNKKLKENKNYADQFQLQFLKPKSLTDLQKLVSLNQIKQRL